MTTQHILTKSLARRVLTIEAAAAELPAEDAYDLCFEVSCDAFPKLNEADRITLAEDCSAFLLS